MNDKEPISIIDTGLQITSFDQLWRVANMLYQSKLVPNAFKTPEQLMVALLRALELKVPPLQAVEGMTVINNRVGLSGDLALSMVESSGLLEKKKVTYTGKDDELCCTVTLQRKGRAAQDYSFSIAEARTAGIYARNAVWAQYPKRMTYYRALGFGLRDEFADVLKGIKTIEELQDYPEATVYEEPDDEQKIADNQRREAQIIERLHPTQVKIVESKPGHRPTPAEALEPAFDEDKVKTPSAPKKPAGGSAPKSATAPVSITPAAEPAPPDDLDLSPSPGEEEQEPAVPQETPPVATAVAPEPAWKDHIIVGVDHKKFHGRKVGELNAAELAIMEHQWLPAVRGQWDDATEAQQADAEAFEKAIEHKKASKPW